MNESSNTIKIYKTLNHIHTTLIIYKECDGVSMMVVFVCIDKKNDQKQLLRHRLKLNKYFKFRICSDFSQYLCAFFL